MPKEIDPLVANYPPVLYTDIERYTHAADNVTADYLEPGYIPPAGSTRVAVIERNPFSHAFLTYAALKISGLDIHMTESVGGAQAQLTDEPLDVYTDAAGKAAIDTVMAHANQPEGNKYWGYLHAVLARPEQMDERVAALQGEDHDLLEKRGIVTATLVENTWASMLGDTRGVMDADESLEQYENLVARGIQPYSWDELLALTQKSLGLS